MKQIYIVENGRGDKKIGMTGNIQRRITQLETGIADGIISVAVSGFMKNACEIEKQLHEANKEHRLNGEWFSEIVDTCDIDFSYIKVDLAEGAIMTFQDSLAVIAKDKEITGQTMRVLMLAMSELEFENYIHIKQVDIAKELGMQKTHVSTAMRMLVDKGIILKIKQGSTTGYKLSPDYGWKGKVTKMEKEKKRILAQEIIDMEAYRAAERNAKENSDDSSNS